MSDSTDLIIAFLLKPLKYPRHLPVLSDTLMSHPNLPQIKVLIIAPREHTRVYKHQLPDAHDQFPQILFYNLLPKTTGSTSSLLWTSLGYTLNPEEVCLQQDIGEYSWTKYNT